MQLVNLIESVRSTIQEARPTFAGDAEWDYHVRESMNAMRLAQVHFHQLAGISSESVLIGRSSWCFDNKCNMDTILSGIGGQMFITVLFFGVLIILMVWHVFDSRREDHGHGREDHDRDSLPTYRQATRHDAGLAPECLEPLAAGEGGEESTASRHTRLLRRLATPRTTGAAEPSTEEEGERLPQVPFEEILERNTAVLERLTAQINEVEERSIRRNNEKLEKAQSENKRFKAEIMLTKHRLDELQRKYYKVSLIPRMLGAKGETVHERLRNALFHNFTFPEVRKHVIEKELGIPTPPDWILTTEAADEFISSHFPGTGTRLSWNRTLPGSTSLGVTPSSASSTTGTVSN